MISSFNIGFILVLAVPLMMTPYYLITMPPSASYMLDTTLAIWSRLAPSITSAFLLAFAFGMRSTL